MVAMRFAARTLQVPSSGIREVMGKAQALRAAGQDVINWHIGRPDFDTPAHIKAACTAAMTAGHVHYAPANGIPALREAIAVQSEREWRMREGSVSPSRVVVCNGGMEAAFVTLMAIVDRGDEVIVPTPNWPNIRWAVHQVGGVAVEVPLQGGVLTADGIAGAVTGRTKAVVLSSPGNPVGTTTGAPELERIAALAEERDLCVISDETYNRLYYGGAKGDTAPSIFSVDGMEKRCVALGTLSKTYAMDGWRVGWAVAPSGKDAALIAKTRYYVSACSPTFTQHAAVSALTSEQDCVAEMIAQYDARRQVLVEGLSGIDGVSLPGGSPTGAFYVFPNVSRIGCSSKVAEALLNDHHIATIDGAVFGAAGDGHLRIAYSCSEDECRRGVQRLASALAAMKHDGMAPGPGALCSISEVSYE